MMDILAWVMRRFGAAGVRCQAGGNNRMPTDGQGNWVDRLWQSHHQLVIQTFDPDSARANVK